MKDKGPNDVKFKTWSGDPKPSRDAMVVVLKTRQAEFAARASESLVGDVVFSDTAKNVRPMMFWTRLVRFCKSGPLK